MSEDDDTGTFVLTGRPLNDHVEDLPEIPEIDYVNSGDYLELQDLYDPASPSSSDNSSCLTMSSDECFDYLALMRDLEAEELPSREPIQKVDHCKFSVSDSVKPDKVVVAPPETPAGLSANAERNNLPAEEFIRSDSPLPGLTNCDSKDVDDEGKKPPSVSEEAVHHTDQGPPLNPYEVGPSSSGQNVSPGAGKQDARGRLKRFKRKSCFMPFHLFL